MRQVRRAELPAKARAYLARCQDRADTKHAGRTLDIEAEWKGARQTQSMGAVLRTLQAMMGERERCMYCMDSHGSDIEHFRPKAVYPQHMFRWPNLLLCCTECGRFKGNQFPRAGRTPLLIDPTREDPWQHLDFDPDTGNLTARYDTAAGDWSAKGLKTVEVLRLDRREALSAGYLKTYRRLCRIVADYLQAPGTATAALIEELRHADDHGLLGWCFGPSAQALAPFRDLHSRHPAVWQACSEAA